MGRLKNQPIATIVLAGFLLLGCSQSDVNESGHSRVAPVQSGQKLAPAPTQSQNFTPPKGPSQIPEYSAWPVTSSAPTAANPAPPNIPAAIPIKVVELPMREWTSGQYKTQATFLGFKDGIVKLQKQPMGTADVPLERLALADREYVKQTLRIDGTENVLVGKVTAVFDGDSFSIADDEGREFKIRLKGADSPEIGQVFGDKAKKSLEDLLLGRTVWIEWHEIDQGFTKGKVYLDGASINLHMIAEGMAWHQKVEDGHARLRNAEAVARANKKGLWINDDPAPPWKYREHKRGLGQ